MIENGAPQVADVPAPEVETDDDSRKRMLPPGVGTTPTKRRKSEHEADEQMEAPITQLGEHLETYMESVLVKERYRKVFLEKCEDGEIDGYKLTTKERKALH